MIRAEFSVSEKGVEAFVIHGHAGLAPAGEDVLCASVSAMALLVMNTLKEVFRAEFRLAQREEDGYLALTLTGVPAGREEAVYGVLRGLMLQLEDLREQYPGHLSVKIDERKGTDK
ncbi:MAG: ribosomal-processing cysteine protease Prp [Clostridia bacterium]|nr:ribosomal-processing cysteine protease Prp [Clostridia bacterium]